MQAFRPFRKFLAAAAAAVTLLSATVQAAEVSEIRLGYADEAPASVVLRKLGLAEQELAADAVKVQWVKLAAGQAVGKSVDVAPAGDAESLVARAAQGQVKSVYVLSRQEQGNAPRFVFLNTTEQFLAAHGARAERVIAAYERARQWIVANPDEAAKLVASERNISLQQARQQLAAHDFSVSRPGPAQSQALKAAAPALVQQGRIAQGVDTARVVDELVDDRVLRSAMRRANQQFAGARSGELALGW